MITINCDICGLETEEYYLAENEIGLGTVTPRAKIIIDYGVSRSTKDLCPYCYRELAICLEKVTAEARGEG